MLGTVDVNIIPYTHSESVCTCIWRRYILFTEESWSFFSKLSQALIVGITADKSQSAIFSFPCPVKE